MARPKTLCNTPPLFSNFAQVWPWLTSFVTWEIDVQACVQVGSLVITPAFQIGREVYVDGVTRD